MTKSSNNYFPNHPHTSRVWIFQSDKGLNTSEITIIENRISLFLNSWKSHGQQMKAEYKIMYNQFVILVLDKSFADVSGCGIDSLVHELKSCQQIIGNDFFNNGNVAFLKSNEVFILNHLAIKKAIEDGIIGFDNMIFINTIITLEELNSNWLVSVEESWVSKFFNSKSLSL